MTPADRDPSDRFDAALEALSRGKAGPLEASAADADLIAVARQLWALDRAQQAPPGMADQIWAELMNQRGLSAGAALRPTGIASPSLNGKAAPRPWRATAPGSPGPVHRRWTMGQLATAALILLTVAGSVAAVRYVTTKRPTTYLEAADKAQVDVLVDATVTGPQSGVTPLSIERWTFAPGNTTLSVPPVDGPQWIVAEVGTLTATVDGKQSVLAPDESLVIPAGQKLVLVNSGQQEATALRGVAAAGFTLEEYDRKAIHKAAALATEAHKALPAGPSRVLFERLTLQPDAVLRIDPASGRDWVGVVSGQLGLTLVGVGLPMGWDSGREREIGASELLPRAPVNVRVSLHNIGTEPLVLLRLRVTPLPEGAS